MSHAVELADIKKWNYLASAIHLGAFLYSAYAIDSAKAEAKIYNYAFDSTVTNISKVDTPVKLEDAGISNLKYLTAAFFLVTSMAHFLYATDFFGRGYYSKTILGVGWNPWRWVEYSISASIMIYIICIVTGTKEQVQAMSTSLIVPGLMLQGFSVEGLLHQNELHKWSVGTIKAKTKIEAVVMWSNFIPAWFLFFVKWFIIISNYQKLAREAKAANKPIDSSVTFMVYSQLVLFSMFGFIQTYQVYRWTSSRPGRVEWNYITYEKAYIILSTFTKLVLAGTVVYALR